MNNSWSGVEKLIGEMSGVASFMVEMLLVEELGVEKFIVFMSGVDA